MEMSVQASVAASLAKLYADAALEASVNAPLNRADAVQADVAAQVSIFALKETLEMAGRYIDLLV
jgi:hypothetical protein